MAQAASITVNDRAATPLAHIFAPRMISTDLALFVESASVPFGERMFTLSNRKSAGKHRIRLKFEIPTLVMETVNGVIMPRVIRTNYADTTFTFDQYSTDQERKDVKAFMANVLTPTTGIAESSIVGLEGVW